MPRKKLGQAPVKTVRPLLAEVTYTGGLLLNADAAERLLAGKRPQAVLAYRLDTRTVIETPAEDGKPTRLFRELFPLIRSNEEVAVLSVIYSSSSDAVTIKAPPWFPTGNIVGAVIEFQRVRDVGGLCSVFQPRGFLEPVSLNELLDRRSPSNEEVALAYDRIGATIRNASGPAAKPSKARTAPRPTPAKAKATKPSKPRQRKKAKAMTPAPVASDSATATASVVSVIDKREETVLEMIRTNGSVTRKLVAEALDIEPRQAGRLLIGMADADKIVRTGPAFAGNYTLPGAKAAPEPDKEVARPTDEQREVDTVPPVEEGDEAEPIGRRSTAAVSKLR